MMLVSDEVQHGEDDVTGVPGACWTDGDFLVQESSEQSPFVSVRISDIQGIVELEDEAHVQVYGGADTYVYQARADALWRLVRDAEEPRGLRRLWIWLGFIP